jgi:MFS family permease
MKQKQSDALWTGTFIRLLILIVFIYIGIALVNSTFSVYTVQQFNGTPSDVSLVSSLMIIASLFFRPIAGFLIDRFGRRVTMALSLGATALISLAFLLPKSILGLILLRLLMGIPFAMNTTGNATLRTDLIPEDKRVDGFNITTIAIMLSALVIGPNLAYWILDLSGFGTLFSIAAGLLLITIANLLLLKFDDIKTRSVTFSIKEIFEPRAFWFALVLGITFIGWPGVMTYGPLYSLELGLSFGGYFFLAYGGGLLFSRFISNYIMGDNKPPAFTAFSLVLVIIGHTLIGFLNSKVGFLTGAVFIGAGYGMALSIFKKMAYDLVEPERRGRCGATIFVIQDIGATIGIYAYGFLAESLGSFSYSYMMAAVITIVPLVILLLVALPDYKRQNTAGLSQNIPVTIESDILK